MKQSDFLIRFEVPAGRLADLRVLLADHGQLEQWVGASGRVHYCSFFVIHDNAPEAAARRVPTGPATLAFEGNVDGNPRDVLRQLLAGESPLRQIAVACGLPQGLSDDALLQRLWASQRHHGIRIFFVSLPGMSLARIRDEARLRDRIEAYLDANRSTLSEHLPNDIRARVRRVLETDPDFLWADKVPPEPWYRRHWIPLDRFWGCVARGVRGLLDLSSLALDRLGGRRQPSEVSKHSVLDQLQRRRTVRDPRDTGEPAPARWGMLLYWSLIDLALLPFVAALFCYGAAVALMLTCGAGAAGRLIGGWALGGLLVGLLVAALRSGVPRPAWAGPPIRFGPDRLWAWFDPAFTALAASFAAAVLALLLHLDPGSAGVAVTAYAASGGLLLALVGVGRWVRGLEIRDAARQDFTQPPLKFVWAEGMKEAGRPQNHMVNITEVKPHLLRRVLLWLILFNGKLRGLLSVAGHNLSGVASIHFARWILLPASPNDPGRKRMLFLSNYDGTWEKYVGEFVDHAGHRMSAAWGHTRLSPYRDCPETLVMWWEGANNEDAFKRYSRNASVDAGKAQDPRVDDRINDLFWYSAYPDLTVQNIHTNKRIRELLYHRPRSDRVAAAWLALI